MTAVKVLYDGASFRPVDVDALKAIKAQSTAGAHYAMTLEPWDNQRTRSQQGLLHELIGRCARATGYSLEALKMQSKVSLGYYVHAAAILSGDIDPPKYRGQFVDLCEVYPWLYAQGTLAFVRSEASYTKHMEGEFIDYIMLYATENGVDIEDIAEAMK